jgi:hypothetical protein
MSHLIAERQQSQAAFFRVVRSTILYLSSISRAIPAATVSVTEYCFNESQLASSVMSLICPVRQSSTT